jgi:hypothetical protein
MAGGLRFNAGKPGDRFRGLSEIAEAVDSDRDLSPILCIKFNKPAASIIIDQFAKLWVFDFHRVEAFLLDTVTSLGKALWFFGLHTTNLAAQPGKISDNHPAVSVTNSGRGYT